MLLASQRGRRKKGKGKGDSCEARKASLALKRAPDFPYSLSPSTIVAPTTQASYSSRSPPTIILNFNKKSSCGTSIVNTTVLSSMTRDLNLPIHEIEYEYDCANLERAHTQDRHMTHRYCSCKATDPQQGGAWRGAKAVGT